MHNNMNVNVSGPVQPTSTYKTKVLKGNHSFVSQVTEPNMKYVIKHNFVLTGDVTIPANCVLQFDGGSISGEHTITLTNTKIVGETAGIFNCELLGNCSGNSYIDWILNSNIINNENINLINCLFNISNTVEFSNTTYYLYTPITVASLISYIKGNNTKIIGSFLSFYDINNSIINTLNTNESITIKDIYFSNSIYGINSNTTTEVNIYDCVFADIECCIMQNTDIENITIRNCKFTNIENGFYLSTQNVEKLLFDNLIGDNIRYNTDIPSSWRESETIKPFKNSSIGVINVSTISTSNAKTQVVINNIIIDGIVVGNTVPQEPDFHGVSIKLRNEIGNDINASNISIKNISGNKSVLTNGQGIEGLLLRGYTVNINNCSLLDAGTAEGFLYIKGSTNINVNNCTMECSEDFYNLINTADDIKIVGIIVDNGDVHINKCIFKHLKEGINSRANSISVSDCKFVNTEFSIYESRQDGTKSIDIKNCFFDSSRIFWQPVNYTTSKYPVLKIFDCQIYNCAEILKTKNVKEVYFERNHIKEDSNISYNYPITSTATLNILSIIDNIIDISTNGGNRAIITALCNASLVIAKGNTIINGLLAKFYNNLSSILNKLVIINNTFENGSLDVRDSNSVVLNKTFISYNNQGLDFNYNKIKGDSSSRPSANVTEGFQYFDTTLNKPIWCKGLNSSYQPIWVDATGATV